MKSEKDIIADDDDNNNNDNANTGRDLKDNITVQQWKYFYSYASHILLMTF
ncbi:hypothetical protein Glove_177g105 [Diversispora epigaea]|uniref:Uncharacterized protein n=1 Tax=Diversispora epigaea TaxID=1348612 RepID=A0A397INF0_9GLOM|nr:hypothetical protein Glove_177g105 [Diversispora epigaea]